MLHFIKRSANVEIHLLPPQTIIHTDYKHCHTNGVSLPQRHLKIMNTVSNATKTCIESPLST